MDNFIKKLNELGIEGFDKILFERDLVANGNTNRCFSRFSNWFQKSISAQTVISDAELLEYEKLQKLEVTMEDGHQLRLEVEKARSELANKYRINNQKRDGNEELKAELTALRRERENAELVLEMLKQDSEKQYVTLAELNSADQTSKQRVRSSEEESFIRNEKLNEIVKHLDAVISEVQTIYQKEFGTDKSAATVKNKQFFAVANIDVLFEDADANLRSLTDYVREHFSTGESDVVLPEKDVQISSESGIKNAHRIAQLNDELKRLKYATELSYEAYLRTKRREVALEAQCDFAKERIAKLAGLTMETASATLNESELLQRRDEASANCTSLRQRILEHETHMRTLVREFAETSVLEPIRVDFEAVHHAQRGALAAHRFVFDRLIRVRCVLECVLFLLERERLFHRDTAKLLGEASSCASRLETRYASRFAALTELMEQAGSQQGSTIENQDEAIEKSATERAPDCCNASSNEETGKVEDALKRLESVLFASETDGMWRLRPPGESQIERIAKMTKSLERCVCELVSQFDERKADEQVRKSRALFAHFCTRNEPALNALCAAPST